MRLIDWVAWGTSLGGVGFLVTATYLTYKWKPSAIKKQLKGLAFNSEVNDIKDKINTVGYSNLYVQETSIEQTSIDVGTIVKPKPKVKKERPSRVERLHEVKPNLPEDVPLDTDEVEELPTGYLSSESNNEEYLEELATGYLPSDAKAFKISEGFSWNES